MQDATLIVCLGNPLRGDDAFGLLVYRLLRRLGVPAVYAGVAPENVVHLVRKTKPKVVIIVDAVREGGEGLIVLRLSDELAPSIPSSHLLPLKLLLQSVDYGPDRVLVVGARAENLALGSRPGERIRRLAVEAASFVVKLLWQSPLPRELEFGDKGSLVARDVEDFTRG